MRVAQHDDASAPIGILLVEDEPAIRLLLRRWIERTLTATIWEAPDGLQALERISEGRVELIISDLNMPVLNGIDMLRLLQADPARDRMEIVIASEVANQESVREAIELGVSDYLLKPLQYDWVTERLRAAVQRIHERRRLHSEDVDRSRTRVLIADTDPNYCQFAESTLSTNYTVSTARTVAEVLVKTLRFKPDVVLLSGNLSGLRIGFLVERLSKLPGMEPPSVYELAPSGQDQPSDKAVKGVIARSFVPENLKTTLLSLLQGGPPPQGGPLAWTSGLRPELETALFQALGMMTGQEPKRLNDAFPLEPELFGHIMINSDEDQFEIALRLEGRLAFAGALMAAMLGEDPDQVETEEEPDLDAVQEILNVVAGRIKNSCLERKVPVTIGLPQIGKESHRGSAAAVHSRLEGVFSWREKHVFRITLLVATVARAADVVTR